MESGAAMMYFTGVRWGRSERTFAVMIPAKGDPAYVLPAFEEMRVRELIRVGMHGSVRFVVFNGIRMLTPKADYVSADAVLKRRACL